MTARVGIGNRKGGPQALAATVGGEPAAVLLEDRAADREAQAQPAEAAGRGSTPLLQDVEDAGQQLRRDADSRVADLDHQLGPSCRSAELSRDRR